MAWWTAFFGQCTQDSRFQIESEDACCNAVVVRPTFTGVQVKEAAPDKSSGSWSTMEQKSAFDAAGPKREPMTASETTEGSDTTQTTPRHGAIATRGKVYGFPPTRALEVPVCFVNWCQEGVQLDSKDVNKKVHDQVVSTFIMSMLRGVQVHVLLDDGSLLAVEASFDVRITRLTLRVRGVERNIELDDIERVAGPEDAQAAWNTNAVHLNDCCMTLVLTDTHYLTFSFDTPKLCSYFEFCLTAVLTSHRLRASKDAPISELSPSK